MASVLRCAVLAAAVFFSAAAGARADEGDYTVKLNRPEAVGEKYNIHAKIDQSNSIKVEVDGAEVKNDMHDASYALEGVLTVTAVDGNGKETGFHLVIKKLEAGEEHAVSSDAVETGTEVDGVYKDGKADFSMKFGELSPTAKRALGAIFEPPHSDQTDDQMFGASGKKKGGDSWPVNAKAMAKDAGTLNLLPEKIDGTVTLFGKSEFAGIAALEFHINVEVSEFTRQGLGKSKDAKMTIKIENQLPVDTANGSDRVKMNMTTHGVFEPEKDGKKALVTLDSQADREETRVLVK